MARGLFWLNGLISVSNLHTECRMQSLCYSLNPHLDMCADFHLLIRMHCEQSEKFELKLLFSQLVMIEYWMYPNVHCGKWQLFQANTHTHTHQYQSLWTISFLMFVFLLFEWTDISLALCRFEFSNCIKFDSIFELYFWNLYE